MNLVIMKEKLGDQLFELCLSEENLPCVSYHGKDFTKIPELLHACKEISRHPLVASKLINFLIQGLRFEVILQPDEFKANYRARIKAEKDTSSLDVPRTSSFGIFNVDEIVEPKLQGDQLIFYAEDLDTGVPYRVTYSFSDQAKPPCKYQLLP